MIWNKAKKVDESQISVVSQEKDFGFYFKIGCEPVVQHRELSSVLCDHLGGWDVGGGVWEGRDIGIHIADSLRCTAETNTTLQSNYTPIKKKVIKKKIGYERWKESKIQSRFLFLAKGWGALLLVTLILIVFMFSVVFLRWEAQAKECILWEVVDRVNSVLGSWSKMPGAGGSNMWIEKMSMA